MLDYRSVKDATKASLKMRVACLLARPSSKDPSRGIDNLARTKMAVVYMISMLVVVGSLRIKLVVGSEKEGRIKSLFPYPKHPGKHLLRFVFSKVCFGGPVTPNLSRCDWMSRVTGGLELFVGCFARILMISRCLNTSWKRRKPTYLMFGSFYGTADSFYTHLLHDVAYSKRSEG